MDSSSLVKPSIIKKLQKNWRHWESGVKQILWWKSYPVLWIVLVKNGCQSPLPQDNADFLCRCPNSNHLQCFINWFQAWRCLLMIMTYSVLLAELNLWNRHSFTTTQTCFLFNLINFNICATQVPGNYRIQQEHWTTSPRHSMHD